VFAGESEVFRAYLAGQIACARELAIFFAPNVNSYKRYAAGSWAPTTLAWGRDNRTCGFRIVGSGSALRAETRIPGGDVNPYLAFAALLAAGLYGIENSLELGPALEGNAYESSAERFPSTLREAIAALEESAMARAAFGDDVVDHYLNYARTEQALFDRVVTNWERERLYERG
jgi:glutamine synthetase